MSVLPTIVGEVQTPDGPRLDVRMPSGEVQRVAPGEVEIVDPPASSAEIKALRSAMDALKLDKWANFAQRRVAAEEAREGKITEAFAKAQEAFVLSSEVLTDLQAGVAALHEQVQSTTKGNAAVIEQADAMARGLASLQASRDAERAADQARFTAALMKQEAQFTATIGRVETAVARMTGLFDQALARLATSAAAPREYEVSARDDAGRISKFVSVLRKET